MRPSMRECLIAIGFAAVSGAIAAAGAAEEATINPPPKPADWAALAQLPDWSGVWTPSLSDQAQRMKLDQIPWTPAAAAQRRCVR